MVLADVFKRFQTLKGREASFCTGTDEHGMKVQRAAELQDVAPKIFCDSNAETFKDLAKKANLANDHFVRTTDPEHRKAVEYFWEQLRRRGYIYETTHSGWYCVSDEAFYPESMVTKQVSTVTGKSYMASTETGNAVEWTEEKNYHFRLTALKDRLLDFLEKNPGWVVPATRMTEVVNWVQNNLEDLSISRPASRLSWGIPVPGDPDQTIYVWVDALINYLTKAGYPQWDMQSSSTDGGWPADVHVIGKDIVRFHCVYWPALLMALDMDLPRRVLSHGHWLMGKQKMSKSIGNVVNPFFAIDRWGVDTMRFFLMRNGGIAHDADYDNSLIVTAYKKDLQGSLGGLLSRVTRSKLWNVGSIVARAHQVRIGFMTDDSKYGAPFDGWLKNDMERFFETDLDPSKALKSIMETIYHVCPVRNRNPGPPRSLTMHQCNAVLSQTEPWNLAKKNEPAATEEMQQIIFWCAETLRVGGILLQPFMPEKAAGLLDRLGVDHSRRTYEYADFHTDDSYGTSFVPLGAGAAGALFPPIPVED